MLSTKLVSITLWFHTDGIARKNLQVVTLIYPERQVLLVIHPEIHLSNGQSILHNHIAQIITIHNMQSLLTDIDKDSTPRIVILHEKTVGKHIVDTDIVYPSFPVYDTDHIQSTYHNYLSQSSSHTPLTKLRLLS